MSKTEPFKVSQNTDHPISLYAATKKSNELMAFSYSHLYDMPITGLRFFTVYGPFGRPDMAYYKFAKAIQNNQPIDIYNNGDMQRDFTYIDDIVEGIINVSLNPPKNSDTINSHSRAPHKILNIGNNKPVALIDFIELIESAMSKKAIKNMLPMQPGDVKTTYADIDELIRDYNFKPRTSIKDGINSFIKWYNSYEIK
jgi:UDP-glucuronate 4-epimerase